MHEIIVAKFSASNLTDGGVLSKELTTPDNVTKPFVLNE
ncbi:hypothetical protein BTN50_0453 [Candidatus Enterovibrio altilux]|uniref:Uncharacterized protein n=1 Tax=Candidatus Enterovibrio altilux TaxID=1927128 RepID=A0A291B7L3_9GAMM|nr:hypothetical protein BTN50_0453 [Candidatus Enterovibrio luxaltus]